MTLAEFRILQPEFHTAPDETVEANLAAAELETPADVWGDKRDQGIRYLTAHMLAVGPSGMNARKKAPLEAHGNTMYWHRRQRLLRQVAGGAYVA